MFPLRNEEQERIAAINEQRAEEVINIFGSDRKEPPKEQFSAANSSYSAAATNSGFTLLALLLIRNIATAGDGEPVLIWWILLAAAAVSCLIVNITSGKIRAEVRGDSITIRGKRFHCSQIDSLKGYDMSRVVLYSGGRRILKMYMTDDNCGELVRWAKAMGIYTEYVYTGDEASKLKKTLIAAGAVVLITVSCLLAVWLALKI